MSFSWCRNHIPHPAPEADIPASVTSPQHLSLMEWGKIYIPDPKLGIEMFTFTHLRVEVWVSCGGKEVSYFGINFAPASTWNQGPSSWFSQHHHKKNVDVGNRLQPKPPSSDGCGFSRYSMSMFFVWKHWEIKLPQECDFRINAVSGDLRNGGFNLSDEGVRRPRASYKSWMFLLHI